MRPTRCPRLKTLQHIQKQRRPQLPANGLLGVPEEVTDLQSLFDLLEKYFNRLATFIKIADTRSGTLHIVGNENHLNRFAIDFDHRDDAAHAFLIMPFGLFGFEGHLVVTQNVAGHLSFFTDMILHVVFRPCDPENTKLSQ